MHFLGNQMENASKYGYCIAKVWLKYCWVIFFWGFSRRRAGLHEEQGLIWCVWRLLSESRITQIARIVADFKRFLIV